MISGKLPQIWFGGDYNPDQWSPQTWQEDLRLFKLANINIATLSIFSWTLLQPSADSYDFAWLDDIIDRIYANHIHICLATGTAAHPAWMAHEYPDVLRTDFHGRQHRFGVRHNSCPNSESYRLFSGRLAERMAERYGRHPGVVAWHVSNEYGGNCYCDQCAVAFRHWLENRYGSLDQLNKRWGTRFWNHTFTHWDQIVPPDARSEYVDREDGTYMPTFQSIVIDYRRFQSQSLLDCFKIERDAIRRHSPGISITTNLMGLYDVIDAHRWGREMDIVSWDSYPANDDDPSMVAMRHAVMRGANGGKPLHAHGAGAQPAELESV